LRKLRYLIGTVIGLALLVWVLKGLNLSQMGETLQSANYVWLLPASLAMLTMFALRAWRWGLLLQPSYKAGGAETKDVSFQALWSGVLIGYFGNFALTANAGELIRAFVLGRKEKRSKSAVLASIVVEKTLDVLVLLGFLALLALTLTLPRWAETMIALGMLMLLVAGGVLIALPRWEAKIIAVVDALGGRVPASLRDRVEHFLRAFITGLGVWRQSKTMLGAVALSCLIWPVLAAAFFFIGQSLGFSIAARAYLLLVALVTLGAIIPTLPGQIGTTEFLVAGGLGVFAVDKEQALAFVILLRLVRLVPLGLGYASLLQAGLGLSDIQSVPTRDK